MSFPISNIKKVKIWFQNRRMKWRNSKERELLASGGSRDQTLPNKNNPNPDLSDARTDRQPSISPASVSPTSSLMEQSQSGQNLDGHFNNSNITPTSKSNLELHAKTNTILVNGCNGKDGKTFKLEKGSSISESTNHSFVEQFLPNASQAILSHINATSSSEENRRESVPQQQQQQLFNNFYDKVRDINNSVNSVVFNSGRSENMANMPNYYYDEFDSNSDEEISVT